jgi:uncharacterized protein YbjT (DUF2867 family)
MTILVTGSRGRVGRALVSILHAQGRPVRAASSDPTTTDLPADVPVVHCALAEPDSLPAALADVRTVFLYAEPAGIADFVAAAEKAGVEHVVLLSSSSVTGPTPESDPIAVRHLEVERALADAPFVTSFLRPGAFATNSLQWAGEIRATHAVVLPYPDSMSAPIDDTDIAAVAAKLITEQAGRGAAYTLTGPGQLSLADQIGIIGAPTTSQPRSPRTLPTCSAARPAPSPPGSRPICRPSNRPRTSLTLASRLPAEVRTSPIGGAAAGWPG